MSEPIKAPLIEAYLKQRPALKRFLVARFRDSVIAEDILQEVYLKLERARISAPIENHAAFLFRVANNLALDYRKKSIRVAIRDREWSDVSRHSFGGEPVQDLPDPEDALDYKKKLACVQATLETMSPQCRRVFMMHKLQGLSHADVSEQLGITRSTVEKHMGKALKTLAVSLKKLENGNDE